MTKQYLPTFQPSKQVKSDLVRARKSLIFPLILTIHNKTQTQGVNSPTNIGAVNRAELGTYAVEKRSR
jgi:hypothetical protein